MGYTVSFLYNETYGVSHVNKITERLTGSGVNPVPVDQSNYSTTDLNKITNAITDSGVTYNTNSCRVIKDSDTNFKILYGSAFFYDGMAIDIDSSGVLLPILNGKNYIYFKKDTINNTGVPIASNTAPGTNDITLAEYENGILTDKRVYAKSKISGYGSNVSQEITNELNGTYNLTASHPNWNDVKQIALKRTDFERVFLNCKGSYYSGNHIRGGYFGIIGSNKKVTWSGGGRCTDFEQFIMKGDAVDSLNGYPEPFIYFYGTSYVQIDFDFSTNGYMTVRLKTDGARNYTLSNLELTLC